MPDSMLKYHGSTSLLSMKEYSAVLVKADAGLDASMLAIIPVPVSSIVSLLPNLMVSPKLSPWRYENEEKSAKERIT